MPKGFCVSSHMLGCVLIGDGLFLSDLSEFLDIVTLERPPRQLRGQVDGLVRRTLPGQLQLVHLLP